MIVSIEIDGLMREIDSDKSIDLGIPLNFNGAQPNAYGADRAVSKAVEAGNLVGDTRRGGSCNFEQYTLIPHCNGTHTECIGHITHERISLLDSLKDTLILAVLISVEPENALDTEDTYSPEKQAEDRLVTKAVIKKALEKPPEGGTQNGLLNKALIIRTMPNDESKKKRDYMKEPPPFFSREAMEYLVEQGVEHLLVDTPSIDRTFDEGKLSNHRIFWNIEPGSFEINARSRVNNTVSEMIYVPDFARDGRYLLNLQVAPFAADAAPSRPVIFRILS